MGPEGLTEAVRKMSDRGVDQRAITVFEDYWQQLAGGAEGIIREETIEPLSEVPELAAIEVSDDERRAALAQVAVIKLNGGLGTSMGMTGPKAALVARDGLTFLDVIVRQLIGLEERYGSRPPLMLMNTPLTRGPSLEILERYPHMAGQDLPLDFLQNMEPKLDAQTLAPVSWPEDPELEWCPPGHGDIYVALASSGLLDQMRSAGIRYAFISNSDNLGATCDPDIAAWLMTEGIPFAAEVAERTLNDRKGGHVAVRKSDGRLILRESAMVVDEEQDLFQDTTRHQWFNTNNLWVDLDKLDALLRERQGVLGLPIIVNHKTVDPTRPDSPAVIQIESAMGTAVESFAGSVALRVPRSRFRPVKTTNELLLLRSDVFDLDEDSQIVSRIDHPEPRVSLDKAYKFMRDFDARFPSGVPSMRDCTSLTVAGEVTFGAGVHAVGDVEIVAESPTTVPDGTRLQGRTVLSQ
ncbi:UTP--glucose-1-phosphate uridylyltransferase [Janibacter sp. Soil728]|uniref:UTP--glucose-1-phosphate uridylyltransferase n=1 Tax=Janibacter sp. Soil728 TaxID=1736393 RepID=UPI0006F5CECA|nr:UTP--glucose-1-phosphate uridylyltransferase [Janibacter sp. Soil728]KRE35973.1 UTP--glucose-1-phosphate uridylyltransferase [Janibacter sp. Soil728]